MKNSTWILLFCILISAATQSCTKSVDPATNNGSSPITAILVVNTWKVNSFLDGTQDKTANFTGITFTFDTTGVFSAGKDNDILTGSWTFSKLFHGVQVNSGSIKLDLGDKSPYGRLRGEWKIESFTPTKVVLTDEDDVNGDHLELIRL